MSLKRGYLAILACAMGFLANTNTALSQVRIISASFSTYNVSPENMCSINISGGSPELTAVVESKITNSVGKEIVKVVSNRFGLKGGVYNTSQLGVTISSFVFQNSALSEYVKLYHQLPSGKYNYNVSIRASDGSVDELNEDIESESSSFLSLITPPDKDTLDNLNPLLLWTHQESFNLTQQGEYFKIVVTEMKSGQSPEASINVNSPLYQLNFLTRHDIQYPYDAPKLLPGKNYAWQVQKVVNGVITNKTEAWQFTLKNTNQFSKTFVEITPKLNVNPYVVQNDKLYFVFNEEYSAPSKELEVTIVDEKGKRIILKATNYLDEAFNKENLKARVTNRYELDLGGSNLKNGNYSLKIFNEKNQEFILKFIYDL